MELILWRHAEAEDGFPDMERSLTAKGEKQAAKIAAFLRSRLPERTQILASPALRTQQTAKALTKHFEIEPGIGPGSDPQAVLDLLGWPEGKKTLLIVGHQPYLGEMAGMLLFGMPVGLGVKKGAIWWLDGRDGGKLAQLRMCIAPDMV